MDKVENRKGKQKIEILSPAGSYACFRAALNAGADAVYAGGTRFGARAYADNFTEEELIRAIREAHLLDRKLYLTVNTLLKDSEIEELYDYLLPLYENGLDAVIVQDAGVLEYVRHCFPEMDIHASTQMTVTDLWGAKFLEEQGASRVVPARELSLEEIRRIRRETVLEEEILKQPVTEIILVGASGQEAAISPLQFDVELDENGIPVEYSSVLTNQVSTGYNLGSKAMGASGQGLSAGYVAVHPGEIPYGTKLYITSADNSFVYGFAIAADTGLGLLGNQIDVDLYYDTYLESCLHGKRNVNIYIL